ncbi:MAG: hypothetical protein H7287_14820, partial [Thermoleophilia bacterium]|nr:hypothetical protein [Thermoleophilia bacterium]
PVKAYTAARRESISFDLLHDEDNAHIEFKRICPVHHEEVPWEHIIKGYEIEPGRYVTFTKEELAELQPEATHSLDIEDFVPFDEIDPMFFDTPYHLAAAPGATRAYDLLRKVMVDAQVVAIARIEEKAAGRTITAPDISEPDATPTSDIMQALEASLTAARAKRNKPAKAAASTKRTGGAAGGD